MQGAQIAARSGRQIANHGQLMPFAGFLNWTAVLLLLLLLLLIHLLMGAWGSIYGELLFKLLCGQLSLPLALAASWPHLTLALLLVPKFGNNFAPAAYVLVLRLRFRFVCSRRLSWF